ncbi:MAG: HAMP domain-containing protein [Cyanobacteria bacterium RU_5_0]|nr:HAMP domain-containing protein [Cyanobacteria bacterium RU_5_0]
MNDLQDSPVTSWVNLTSQSPELVEEEVIAATRPTFDKRRKTSWWNAWSLPRKATALAIIIAVVPVAAIGGIAYTLASRIITAQIITEQESRIAAVRSGVSAIINGFVEEAETLSKLSFLADETLNKTISVEQKIRLLDNFIEASHGKYDNIAVFDPSGDLLFQSNSSQPLSSDDNYSNRESFQHALRTQSAAVGNPKITIASSDSQLEVAAPIRQVGTGEILGVVLIQMSSTHLNEIFEPIEAHAWEYQLIDSDGQIFAAAETELIGQQAEADYEELPQSWAQIVAQVKGDAVLTEVAIDRNDQEQVLVSFTPISELEGVIHPGWGVSISRPTAQAFAPLSELRQILFIGMGTTTLLVGMITAILAHRTTRPLLAATHAVEKMGRGELDTRLDVQGTDEMAVLCSTINGMAEQLEEFVQQKNQLHSRILELLLEVDPVSKGNLSIRANVTDDEVGTIADSYNSIIESLRRIVIEVQTATDQVETTTNDSKGLVQALAGGALQQLEKITAAIQRIQTMADSIHAVATNAKAAEVTVQQATETVQQGNELMNLTVDGIVAIRETVAETAKRVKHLGECSQKISTVVSLIKSFAEQTNVLALNASIEAARAGEEGRGFAIVAEEVRELAQQSAKATTDIEKLVSSIQRATGEVVDAMEFGTQQVVSGTHLVDQTRLELTQIVTANDQINQVVKAIVQSTVEQAQNSEIITQTMAEVAAIAENTAISAADVSASFKELLAVAKVLQGSASQFKV